MTTLAIPILYEIIKSYPYSQVPPEMMLTQVSLEGKNQNPKRPNKLGNAGSWKEFEAHGHFPNSKVPLF